MHEADLMGFDMRKYYEKSLFSSISRPQFQEDDRRSSCAARQGAGGLQHQDARRDRPNDAGHLGDRGEARATRVDRQVVLHAQGARRRPVHVEEHAKPGEAIGEDVLLPIYLSDGAIHLEYYRSEGRSTAP